MSSPKIRYGSVCSGVEAATVAWHDLGWQPQWFSQYDPEHNHKNGMDFPSAVLDHHYPHIPNLGDMTKLKERNEFINKPIDLLVGGTPCQAFSVAGLRRGLDDERGNLSLEYVRLLDAKRPRWFLWENVPGVLSSNGGADFAAILSAWTGRDIAAQKFSKSGIIQGEFYSIAWRILDAQYFGVAQRRRRVFVVGYLGTDWRPPVAVLFERESLRGDIKKGGKKRKEVTATTGTGVACTIRMRSGCEGGGKGALVSDELSLTLATGNDQTLVAPMCYDTTQITSPLNYSNPQEGDPCHPLAAQAHVPLVTYSMKTAHTTSNGWGIQEEAAHTLDCTSGSAVCRVEGEWWDGGQQADALTCTSNEQRMPDKSRLQPVICSTGKEWPAKTASTLNASFGTKLGLENQHINEGAPLFVEHQIAGYTPSSFGGYSEGCGTLRKEGGDLGGGSECLICYPINTMTCQGRPSDNGRMGLGIGDNGEPQNTLSKAHHYAVGTYSIARRLTPIECERLQGFPVDYSNIKWKGKDVAPDGLRYKAMGNSMAVPVMRFIGERIQKVDEILNNL